MASNALSGAPALAGPDGSDLVPASLGKERLEDTSPGLALYFCFQGASYKNANRSASAL
jgi:hypothetical protein